jgi:hypothetical protein
MKSEKIIELIFSSRKIVKPSCNNTVFVNEFQVSDISGSFLFVVHIISS